MTNTIGFTKLLTVIVACAMAAPALSQDVPPPPVEQMEALAPGMVEGSISESIDGYLRQDHIAPSLQDDAMCMWDGMPPAPESSGTWLRRGWWSAEIDAVVMVRKWDRAGPVLAFDGSTQPSRLLRIDATSPSEASARLNLGRFLFRDIDNRDHTVEFTVMGGGEFHHSCALVGDEPNQLNVNFLIDHLADASFQGASSMNATYTSRLNSFEWNYKVTSRMKRDRMELQPNGQWIRRANPGITYHALAGMRYLDLTESLLWTADDIVNVSGPVTFTGENGIYRTDTSNDMFGFQAGGGATYESDRWSLTFFSKAGILMSDAKSNGQLIFQDPTTGVARTDVGFTNNDRSGRLPLVVQGGILGRWHLRPNVSLRAGYEFMYLTATALAPQQLDFTPEDGKVSANATPFYHGMTFGSEFFW